MQRAGVLILAGGEATRLPGKLELDAGAMPMLARVFANLSPGRETWLSIKGTLAPRLDAHLNAPAVVDRWSGRGPLAGMLSTMARMRARWVFVAAGDAPLLDGAFVDELCDARRAGDEAVVPLSAHGHEPLAALYDRLAFVRAGLPVLRRGSAAVRDVVAALRAQSYAPRDARALFNVNRPADYATLRAMLGGNA